MKILYENDAEACSFPYHFEIEQDEETKQTLCICTSCVYKELNIKDEEKDKVKKETVSIMKLIRAAPSSKTILKQPMRYMTSQSTMAERPVKQSLSLKSKAHASISIDHHPGDTYPPWISDVRFFSIDLDVSCSRTWPILCITIIAEESNDHRIL